MADTDKNIVITPNKGVADNEPTITFTGFDNNSTTLRVYDDGSLSLENSSQQLFSVNAIGNVGIGIDFANVDSKFKVVGDTRLDNVRIIDNSINSVVTNADLNLQANGSGNIKLTGNVLPAVDATYSIGSNNLRAKSLYVSDYGINIGNTTIHLEEIDPTKYSPKAFYAPYPRMNESIGQDKLKAIDDLVIVGGSTNVWLYEYSTGTIVTQFENPNINTASVFDSFGLQVDISNRYIAIAARDEDEVAGTNSGVVYLYDRTLIPRQKGFVIDSSNYQNYCWVLENPNVYSTVVSDRFGQQVSVSGDYLAVSASNEDDAGGTTSGVVYLYDLTTFPVIGNTITRANSTTHCVTIKNANVYGTSQSDSFGGIIALNNNYLAVAAIGEDDALGFSMGVVYLYDLNLMPVVGSTIDHTNYLSYSIVFRDANADGDTNSTSNDFGESLGFNDKYLAISANFYNNSNICAYLYELASLPIVGNTVDHTNYSSYAWVVETPNAYSSISDYGIGLSLSKDYMALGSSGNGGDDIVGVYKLNNLPSSKATRILSADYILEDPNFYYYTDDHEYGKILSITDTFLAVGADEESWQDPYFGDFEQYGAGVVYSYPLKAYNIPEIHNSKISGYGSDVFIDANANVFISQKGLTHILVSPFLVNVYADIHTNYSLTVDNVFINRDSVLNIGTNADLNLQANGTGTVNISGLSYPSSDGAVGQVVQTDGAGALSFVTLQQSNVATTANVVDIQYLSQAAYDALSPPNANTIYLIV